jgi:ribosomal protein L21E
MEVLKQYTNPFVWVSILILSIIVAGCGGSGGSDGSSGGSGIVTPIISTAFSEYSLAGSIGVINETEKTIVVTLPNGTDVTSLIATYTTAGSSVKVGTIVQTSTVTANNFTAPVAYVVTASDGTMATYTVSVHVAGISENKIIAYSFAGYTGATGVINETAKTIAVTVPNGTNVTALVATFTTTGTNVKVGTTVQTSSATANNFTSPVAYTVTAGDGSTAIYTVSVSVATSTAKAMSAYSFAGYTGATGVINEAAKTIAVTVPNGTNVTALVATFTTTGTNVKVGTTVQTSSATANNFTSPVAYTVTAGDGSTAIYTVSVSVATSTAKAMSAYSFAGYTGATGVINETAKTIAVTVPNGTNVTALVATFTTTGTNVKVGTTVQTSSATANNFTSPVAYTVTAGDGSTAIYTVSVNVASVTIAAVSLGTAGDFAILTKAGVSTTGTTAVVGDIGVSPIAAIGITGFSLSADASNTFSTSPLVTGRIYAADYAPPTPAKMTTAISDMETAYTAAAGRTAGVGPFLNLGGGTLTNQTLAPGIYTWGSALTIPTNLTFNGGANDVWILQVSGTLGISSNMRIILAGGAQAKNIFWQASGAVTLNTGSHFEGIILAQTNIAMLGGATINGRLLAQTAVTLDASTITAP